MAVARMVWLIATMKTARNNEEMTRANRIPWGYSHSLWPSLKALPSTDDQYTVAERNIVPGIVQRALDFRVSSHDYPACQARRKTRIGVCFPGWGMNRRLDEPGVYVTPSPPPPEVNVPASTYSGPRHKQPYLNLFVMPTRGQAILIAASAIPIRKKNLRVVFLIGTLSWPS